MQSILAIFEQVRTPDDVGTSSSMIGTIAVTAASIPVGLLAFRSALQLRARIHRRLSSPGHIATLEAWKIGGIRQWVRIRGENRQNPLLLNVHGGPGFPNMPFSHATQRGWENAYTVVDWDQRNTGKTLTDNGVQTESLTLDVHVSDGLEIVARLGMHFPGVPIILCGHSWGTAVAIEMARQRPDWFAAYVGLGQVSHFYRAEEYGIRTALTEAKRRNDTSAISILSTYEGYPNCEAPLADAIGAVRRVYFRLGFGHHRQPRIMGRLLWLAFQSPDYGWRDFMAFFNTGSQTASMRLAVEELPKVHGKIAHEKLPLPVIIVGGEFDLFTPTPMARELFDTLESPDKTFIELTGVAHFLALEAAPEIYEILSRISQDLRKDGRS